MPLPRAHLPASRDYLALPAASRIGWVLVLGSMTSLGALTIDLYLPAFPVLQDELGTTSARVQLTLTGTLAGFALGQLVVGPLSDSLGRRVPLLAGLGLHLAASAACAVAPTIGVLGVLRVLQGVGTAAASVVALAVVRDLFDGPGAARLVSRLVLVIGVAPVLAPSVGSYLLAVTSWRGIFVLLAAIAATLFAVAMLRLPETLPRARRRPIGVSATASTYRVLLSDRAMVGLVLAAGLTMSALFSYVAAAPFVLQELYGLDPQQFALAFAAVGGSLVVGTQTTGQLVSRVAPGRLLVAGLCGAITASSVLLALVTTGTGGLGGLVIALCATTFGVGLAMPTGPSMVLARHGWAAGTAAALLGFGQFGVGAAVSPVVGLLGLRGDLTMAVAITVGLVLALLAYLVLARPVLARAPVVPVLSLTGGEPAPRPAAGSPPAGQPAGPRPAGGSVGASRAAR